MQLKKGLTLAILLAIALIVRTAPAEITPEAVDRAIRRGADHLVKQQRVDGSWAPQPGFVGGMSALCTLALINAGVPLESPTIQKGLTALRRIGEPNMVYTVALQTMVFCAATPDQDRLLISRNVEWLENAQIKTGPWAGGWRYSDRQGGGDNSNSQFALLALHEAQRIGVSVQETTWQLALDHWLDHQNDDGSWSYSSSEPGPRGSMTCAGISSVVISLGKISEGDASVVRDEVECCGQQTDIDAVERGVRWLANEFSVARNPRHGSSYLFYYLYGLERAGRLTGRRFIGQHDWFREGAEFLLGQQNPLTGVWRGDDRREQNSLLATSFALLFLSKGRRPVLMSQLAYGDGRNWNWHRGAVQNLTRHVERSWRRDLTWQTIDFDVATAQDLLASPVLFLSGRDGLQLTRQQKTALKQYVSYGGFVLAEGCCGGTAFDKDFRLLLQELFPESSLRLLPPEHPVWFAEGPVDDKYLRKLYGVDACCRTSVIYCPGDLSCFWDLSRGGRVTEYSPAVQAEIEACLQIGQNIVAYATNRELRSKFDRPSIIGNAAAQQLDRAFLSVPKLLYRGGGDDAPNALPNLLNIVAQRGQIRVRVENRLIEVTESTLFEYPILFMHGRRAFRFSDVEREILATYLKRGGLLFADAICGSPEFADAFRREVSRILPGQKLQRIPGEHELFSDRFHGHRLRQVTLREPATRSGDDPLQARLTTVSPLLEGADVDGRLGVILSPYDLSCALEYSLSLECKGYVKEDAARIGFNVIMYALQQ